MESSKSCAAAGLWNAGEASAKVTPDDNDVQCVRHLLWPVDALLGCP